MKHKLNIYNYPIEVWSDTYCPLLSLLDNSRFRFHSSSDFIITKDKPKPICLVFNPNSTLFANNDISIQLRRKSKSNITLTLDDSGIPIPDYITTDTTAWTSTLTGMNKMKKYMIKPEYGARSMGMYIVDYNLLYSMSQDIELFGLTKKEFSEKYKTANNGNINKRNDSELHSLYNALKSSSYMLQEVVDVEDEYRVIYTYGSNEVDWVIEKRKGYRCDSVEKREHMVVDNKQWKEIPQYVLDTLKSFGDKSGAPWLSFDVYITKRDMVSGKAEWGVFEYDTQFGIDYPNDVCKRLEKQMSDALEYRIDELCAKHPNITFSVGMAHRYRDMIN